MGRVCTRMQLGDGVIESDATLSLTMMTWHLIQSKLPWHKSVTRPCCITKCKDEYAVSQQRQALSVKANTRKFLGLHAEKLAKPNSAKTAKHSWKDFVYGVLFVTLLAFGAKRPLNHTAQWFCYCTSDCEYFYDLTGTDGKDCSKMSIYRHLREHAIPKDENNGRVVKDEQSAPHSF